VLTGRFEPPDEATIRRVLERIDAGALDSVVGSWLGAALVARQPGRQGRAGSGRWPWTASHCAAPRHASAHGQAIHLLAVCDQQAAAVLGQACVDGKTNEITGFAPLLEPLDLAGCVVTADAMHTQREHAEFLVGRKNADYIMIVKKNQPSLHAQIKNLPWRTSRPQTASATAGTAARSPAQSRLPPSPPGWPSRTQPRPSPSPAASGPSPPAAGGPSPPTGSPA